jgi:hypothetical protein
MHRYRTVQAKGSVLRDMTTPDALSPSGHLPRCRGTAYLHVEALHVCTWAAARPDVKRTPHVQSTLRIAECRLLMNVWAVFIYSNAHLGRSGRLDVKRRRPPAQLPLALANFPLSASLGRHGADERVYSNDKR